MKRTRTLLFAVVCTLSLAAQAQWQWIDKDGRRVFSDRAPPSNIPLKNVLRQPGSAVRGVDTPTATAPATPASAAAPLAGQTAVDADSPRLSAVDKDLLEKKKQAEAAAAAKVKADEDRISRAKQENCERARAGRALMASGVRVSLTNSKGEREVLDDYGRAVEQKRIEQAITANCK